MEKYCHDINGMSSLLMRTNAKLNAFNQMHQSWRKLIEIMIAMPVVLSWYDTIALLVSLVRVIGLLFLVKTENNRSKTQKVLIPIFQAS